MQLTLAGALGLEEGEDETAQQKGERQEDGGWGSDQDCRL